MKKEIISWIINSHVYTITKSHVQSSEKESSLTISIYKDNWVIGFTAKLKTIILDALWGLSWSPIESETSSLTKSLTICACISSLTPPFELHIQTIFRKST